MQEQRKIQAGQTLSARSIGDHDCIFIAEVIERTPATATVKAMGRTRRCKIHLDEGGNEFIFAIGRYSMAPVFRA